MQCSEWLGANLPELFVYDFDPAVLRTGYDLGATPEVLFASAVKLAPARDPSLFSYFLEHLARDLARSRPDIRIEDIDASALERAYGGGVRVDAFLDGDIPLKVKPVGFARSKPSPARGLETQRIWWIAGIGGGSLLLICLAVIAGLAQRSPEAAPREPNAALPPAQAPQSDVSVAPSLPSASTEPSNRTPSSVPRQDYTPPLGSQDTKPTILAANCAPRITAGQAYLILNWDVEGASKGQVEVNGNVTDIDPTSGTDTVPVNFGVNTAKFMFSNSSGGTSKVIEIQINRPPSQPGSKGALGNDNVVPPQGDSSAEDGGQ